MKKKAGELLRLAQKALERAGANPATAAATAQHPPCAAGSEIADDLLVKTEQLAAG